MSNDKILEEIRRYCDPYSLLVIADRKLIRIMCPFKVRFLRDAAGWKEGEVVSVEKVMVTRELLMVYLIDGNAYAYYLFKVVIN